MIKVNRRWLVYLAGLVIVVGAYLMYLDFFSKTIWRNGGLGNASSTPEFTYFSALDGRGVENAEEATPRVVAAMIDNHVDARPQSGLAEASVVYEALVEGNITRYMALYDAKDITEKVGPVRSARPYYLDWLAEYGDALYMHVGGSPDALSLIKTGGVFDANEFYWGLYYWRDTGRFAPHNVYTKNEKWQEIIVSNLDKHPLKQWDGWNFTAEAETPSEWVDGIIIKYDPIWDYNVGWKYVSTVNKFVREANGVKYLDAKGGEILADNVIVQTVKTRVIDDYGRRAMTTIGEGEMFVLKNGHRVSGHWKKENQTSRTRFYDEGGKEINLLPGKTWVQIVGENTVVETT